MPSLKNARDKGVERQLTLSTWIGDRQQLLSVRVDAFYGVKATKERGRASVYITDTFVDSILPRSAHDRVQHMLGGNIGPIFNMY